MTDWMTRTDILDLTRNLTEKRIPAELQGFDHYRLVIWEIDPDTNGRFIQDIVESTAKMTIYYFNARRKAWAAEGLHVSLEPAVYS